MVEKIELSNRPNVDHFHYPGKDKDGKETNGRLAATVYSAEITSGENAGKVALGITRARFNPSKPNSNETKLSRVSGQRKAEARLNNFVSFLNEQVKPKSDTPEAKVAYEKRVREIKDTIDQNLVCILSKEDYEKRIKSNPFVSLDCEFGRNQRAIQSLKDRQGKSE